MRQIFAVASLAAFSLFEPSGVPAQAAGFPDRPIHFVVGFAPGGGADEITRVIAHKLSEKWGQPVLVENREGSDGDVASEYVSRAAPDGYTIMEISNDFTVAPALRKLRFDPVTAFAPVTMMVTHPDVLIINKKYLPIASARELIDYAKSKPGQLNFGSSGRGSPTYMFMQLFMHDAGIDMVNVSYRSMGPALVAMLGGEVQLAFAGVGNVVEQVKADDLQALAVSTNFRIPALPDTPTVAEATGLSNFNEGAFNGVLAPAGTPKEIVEKLQTDIAEVVKAPDMQAQFFNEGLVAIGSTPEEFADFVKTDIAKWDTVLQTIPVK